MNDSSTRWREGDRTPIASALPKGSGGHASRVWWLALAVTLGAALWVNPLGFIGGGWDDWQYLNAARCWREFGPCLPADHWQARWPVIAPIAAVTWLFGESRLTVSLAPLLASIACLWLLVKVGNRLFFEPVGFVAALLLLVAPAFSIQILDPSVEAIELAFLLTGFLSILLWNESRRWHWSFLSGLGFGLALQVRETAIVGTAFSAIFVVTRKPRLRLSDAAFAMAGFALPLLIEFFVFAAATGDPLYRRNLSLTHTLIPSSELLGPIDRTHSPLFNPNYIANWRHEPGLHIHWAVDGLLNLFVDGKTGLLFSFTLVFLTVGKWLVEWQVRKKALRLFLLSIAYASALIYVLAVDPKARIMFVPLAMNATALALLALALWKSGRRLAAATICASSASLGLFLLFSHQSTAVIESSAARWIATYPGQIEVDPNTRRHLALVPQARSLAGLDSNSTYLIYNSVVGCELWLRVGRLPKGSMTVIDYVNISRMGWLEPRLAGALCLMRYDRPVPASTILNAIRRSRPDGPYLLAPRKHL